MQNKLYIDTNLSFAKNEQFNELVQRTHNWNLERYTNNEFNMKLFLSLIKEEATEYVQASVLNLTEQIDALCDILFVTIGALGKLKYDSCEILNLKTSPLINIDSILNFNDYDRDIRYFMFSLINFCFGEAKKLGVTGEIFLHCYEAVVQSNETKSKDKIDSNKKYGVNSKGPNYKAPTEDLNRILSKCTRRYSVYNKRIHISASEQAGTTLDSSFKKFDTNKPMHDLIPPMAQKAMAEVLTFGANKYGRNNWKKLKPSQYNRYLNAALRHMQSIRMGETVDKETNLPHTWHLITNVAFLIHFEHITGIEEFNRLLNNGE